MRRRRSGGTPRLEGGAAPSLLLTGCRFPLPPDGAAPGADALLVAGGVIRGVGRARELRRDGPAGVREVDLGGRAVIPGLVDSHCHMQAAGDLLRIELPCAAGSLAGLADRVRRWHEAAPGGRWLLGRGWREDLFRDAPGRWPTAADLERWAPGRPAVLVRACGHAAVASAAALAVARVAEAADPPGGRIERDGGGRPTGVLRETAVDLVLRWVPQPEEGERRAALAAALRLALSFGVTTVHSMDAWSPGEIDAVEERYRAVGRDEGVAIRACLLWPAEDAGRLAEQGRRTGSGDLRVRLGPAKLFADGSFGARTAALFEPYADTPGSRGLLRHEPAELGEMVWRAHAAGHQVAVHAIGDRAAHVALQAILAAQRRGPRPGVRHRLIHLQLLRVATLRALARAAAAGTVVADVQPGFAVSDAPWIGCALGGERLERQIAYPLVSLLGAGVPVSAGSDAPVEPQSPWLGVRAALRPGEAWGAGTAAQGAVAGEPGTAAITAGAGGAPPGPGPGWWRREAVDLVTALRLHTAGGAHAEGAETWKGVLRPGAAADLAVLDRSLDARAPGDLAAVRSTWTLVGGVTAHGGP